MMPYTYSQLFGPQPAPDGDVAGVLADVDARFVPGVLALLETKKLPSAWEEGDYSAGYSAYTKLQWGLLMDASNRIISEIRQVRGPKVGQNPLETYDPVTTPQYNGTQLFDVLYNSTSGLEGINEKLQVLIEQGIAEGAEEQLELLRGIFLLLGGTI